LVLPLVAQSWRLAFAAWAIPVAAIALVLIALAPRETARAAAPLRWWPDWRSGLIWRLGLMFGANNATYFSANAFIPDFLHLAGRSELIDATLSALNTGQLPASFLLLVWVNRVVGRPWPYVACGALTLASVVGIVSGPGWLIVTSAAVLGFAGAATLTLMLALPPLLSAPDDVHRLTAAMFTISYSCAVILPVASGLAWDASGVPSAAFVPIALCGAVMLALAPTIPQPASQSQPS